MFSRTKAVLGKNNFDKLQNSNIAVVGLGGVGGYVAEMFARLGVKNLTIIDFDKIDKSNLNRQIISLNSTVGQNKTDAFAKRIIDINPNIKLITKTSKVNAQNVHELLIENYDFVVDAIDDTAAKVEIIKHCASKNINLICAMGTANRYKQIPQFEVCDIFKTSYDKLSKKMRTLLKQNGIKKQTVVYTKQQPEHTNNVLGSVVYYPFMCAGTIVSYVVNKLLGC